MEEIWQEAMVMGICVNEMAAENEELKRLR